MPLRDALWLLAPEEEALAAAELIRLLVATEGAKIGGVLVQQEARVGALGSEHPDAGLERPLVYRRGVLRAAL